MMTPSSISSDLRRTARGLLRHPGFTAAAVLTLALGLGATTAIFGVVYGVLIKPLPYPDAARAREHSARGSRFAGERSRVFPRAVRHVSRGEPCFEHVGFSTARRTNADGLGRSRASARADGDARHSPGARRAARARPLVLDVEHTSAEPQLPLP